MKTFFLLKILFLVPLLTFSQSNGNNGFKGWYFLGDRHPYEYSIKKNKDEPFVIDHLILKNKSGEVALGNTLAEKLPKHGQIELSFQLDSLSLSDTSDLFIYLVGKMQNHTPLYYKYSIKKIPLKPNNIINVNTPFEGSLDTIKYGIALNGSSSLSIKNLKLNVSLGEFDKYWEKDLRNKLFENDSLLITKLFTIGKIWGFLKYFSSKISENDIDWDKELVTQIDKVMRSNTFIDFSVIVDSLIAKSCDNIVLNESKFANTRYPKSLEWMDTSNLLNKEQKLHLVNVYHSFKPFYNKYIVYPQQSEKPSPIFNEDTYDKNSLPNINYRILTLLRFWNIIEYHYAYKDMINDNWDLTLKTFLPRFALANTLQKYRYELLSLNNRINDGHSIPTYDGDIFSSSYLDQPTIIPIRFNIVDDSIYVSKVDSLFSSKTNIREGMKLLRLNNHLAKEHLEKVYGLISHNRLAIKNSIIEKINILSFVDTGFNKFVFEQDGSVDSIVVKSTLRDRYKYISFLSDRKSPKKALHLIDSNLYINAGTWTTLDMDSTLLLLKSVKNVIIDTRDYTTMDFLSFSREFVQNGQKNVKFEYVDVFPGKLKEVTPQIPNDNKFKFEGKIYVLISENTRSRAEYLAMILKANIEQTVVIGRQSYGANGDISIIPIIGNQNLTFSISGLKVLFSDGKKTQGIGIVPDFEVNRPDNNQDDIDLILKRALNLSNQSHLNNSF